MKEINTRLNELILVAKRRLVTDVIEPFFKDSTPECTLVAAPQSGNTCVSSKLTHKVYWLPDQWVTRHRDRANTIRGLGEDPVPLLLTDLSSSVETAAKVVLTLWSALRSHFDLDYSRNLNNLIDSVLWYVPMCGEEQEFIPFLKYQLAYLFAKAEKQFEMPERPGWIPHKDGLVLTGFLGKFLKVRSLGRSLLNTEFRVTLLTGVKKGMPQMGDFHLRKNLRAMKDRLTKVKTTPECLLEEIRRTTKEIYPKKILYEDWLLNQAWTSVSNHASFEFTRASGGVLTHLRLLDLYGENGTKSVSVYHSAMLMPDQLASMFWDPMEGKTGEIRWPSWTVERVLNSVQRYAALEWDGIGKASAKPIFEPFKVRMISAGDILSNGVFSNVQKLLWKGLQRFEQFGLTGKSVVNNDLEKVDTLSREVNMKLKLWVSGDYSAATDNLHTDATRACIDTLAGDPVTRKILVRGLQKTRIDFDSLEIDDVPEPFEMTNGQLMGCVFSFPILCIINLAVYRASLEAWNGQKYWIKDLPVLVNGDDILFKTSKSHYRIWSGLIAKVGFEKSVGKNYVSPDFAMINSTYFRMSKHGIQKIPYLNIGWCTGVSKGGSGGKVKGEIEDEKTILRIGSQVEKTRVDWLTDLDLKVDQNHLDRRAEILNRFRDEIHLWNWDRILDSRVSVGHGPGGLHLKDEVPPIYDAFSYYLYNNREKLVAHGLDSQPKSMAPWKVTQSMTKPEDFRPLWKKFLKDGGVKTWVCQAQRYLESSFESVRREFRETRYSVGQFPIVSISSIDQHNFWIDRGELALSE